MNKHEDYTYGQAAAILFAFRCAIESMEKSVHRILQENESCGVEDESYLNDLLIALKCIENEFSEQEQRLLQAWNA